MMNNLQLYILSTAILSVSLASSFSTQPRFIPYSAPGSSSSSSSLIQPSPPTLHSSLVKQTASSPAPAFRESQRSALAAADVEAPPSSLTNKDENGNDDDEWDYEEYEDLVEADFYGSEWKVGTVMDGDASSTKKLKIEETWCRLLVEEVEQGVGKGQLQRCIWGDGGRGKWKFDRASQFLSLSKDTYGGWLGKRIWAGTVTDFYYLDGSVRGWSPISSATVLGQWQAKRLGVDKGEAGKAPWFEEKEEVEEEVEEEVPQLDGADANNEIEAAVETPEMKDSIQKEAEEETGSESETEIETPWFEN